jgi:DNA polymerase elongation subunit (family B)
MSETTPTSTPSITQIQDVDTSFRLFDFNIFDEKREENKDEYSDGHGRGHGDGNGSDDADNDNDTRSEKKYKKDDKCTTIQMFGLNEKGETCALFVRDYSPFFYIKVGDDWTIPQKSAFISHLKDKLGKYYQDSILEFDSKLIKRKKLYGFDAGKEHKFVLIKFKNIATMNKVKGMWFRFKAGKQVLRRDGYYYSNTRTEIYEANIPPILRFFHIHDISPSGWVGFQSKRVKQVRGSSKTTTCSYEYEIESKYIVPLNSKETIVPYKICSFDIEASSSHGDFPIPVKTYKKLATNMVDICGAVLRNMDSAGSGGGGVSADANAEAVRYEVIEKLLKKIVYTAFSHEKDPHGDVDRIYTKIKVSESRLATLFGVWISYHIPDIHQSSAKLQDLNTIEKMFEKMSQDANQGDVDADGDGDGDGGDEYEEVGEVEEVGDVEEVEEVGEVENQCGDDNNGDDEADKLMHAYAGNVSSTSTKTSTQKPAPKTTTNAKKSKEPIPKETPKETPVHLLLCPSDKMDRETKINMLNVSLQEIFPPVEGDKVTFIGSTFLTYGNKRPYLNHCIVLNTCDTLRDEVANSEIQTCKTERELLLAWTQIIQRENPDIIIGYNIFGFDYEFMFRRSLENSCENEFLALSRNKGEFCGTRDYKTGKIGIKESSIVIASGQHDLRYIDMTGRLQVDLYNYFRRDFNLTSYKLDYCAGYFIGDGVKKIEHLPNGNTKVTTSNMMGLENGNYIHFEESSHSTDMYKEGEKFKVLNVNPEERSFEIEGREMPDMTKSVRWGLAKDDVTPQDIFRMTNEGPKERAIIAKYCIQDCNLVHHLMNKIDVLTGYIEMSKICSVPISFLVLRGQSIKLTSFIAKKCREKRTLMPVLERSFGNESYEGAICLPPKCNLYLDNPVACLDYSSLYPSSMISENLSHDSKVWTREFDLAGQLVRETGVKDPSGNYIYDNLSGYEYVDVTYDTYKWVPNSRGKAVKTLNGKKICRFAQPKDGVKAIMPDVLEELLAARKATRKLAEATEDPFMANILDKRQLGYKVTANSLYGQCGAKTSTFYDVDIAASTTATGRKLLTYGKRVVEEVYGDAKMESKKFGFVNTKAEYIYGDTDSVFFTFNLATPDGTPIRGKDALEITIEFAKEVGHLATRFLKQPHAWVYEKTLMPFCLLSKKRYIGMLYEDKPEKPKRKSMGIVLKRRDNAPIVKDIYGGVIDILMKEQNVETAIQFLKSSLQNLVDEKVPMDKLIISKSLRSGYKNPAQIAHKVLADRMGKRDPGNKPSVGDRIPFVYIQNPDKKALQGERIEHPDYILANKIKPNYAFYITNQIMKPLQQVFALVLENIPSYKRHVPTLRRSIETWNDKLLDGEDEEKIKKKITDLRNKEVKKILFDEYLVEIDNACKKNQSIMNFFKKK